MTLACCMKEPRAGVMPGLQHQAQKSTTAFSMFSDMVFSDLDDLI